MRPRLHGLIPKIPFIDVLAEANGLITNCGIRWIPHEWGLFIFAQGQTRKNTPCGTLSKIWGDSCAAHYWGIVAPPADLSMGHTPVCGQSASRFAGVLPKKWQASLRGTDANACIRQRTVCFSGHEVPEVSRWTRHSGTQPSDSFYHLAIFLRRNRLAPCNSRAGRDLLSRLLEPKPAKTRPSSTLLVPHQSHTSLSRRRWRLLSARTNSGD